MSAKRIRQRIEIIDMAKCIAIFMVVLGHTATNEEIVGANPSMLVKILYSIHMPLFFCLSGLSISPKPLKGWKMWRLFLRKTVLTITIPYLLWALIFSNFSFENLGWILYGSWIALGKTGTVTSLWYLSSLFFARVLVQCVIALMGRIDNRRPAYLVPAAVCLVIGVLFPRLEIGYPWCFDIAFVACGCILLGIAVRNGLVELSVQKGWVLIAMLAVSTFLYVLTVLLAGDQFTVLLMANGEYGNPFLSLILALLGGFAILALSMILKRMANEWIHGMSIQPMIYLGQHTMGIFLLHKPMLQSVFMPAFGKLFGGGPDMVIRLLSVIASILVSLWLSQLISYYIPELVGIFSKDRIAGKEKKRSEGMKTASI